MQRKSQCNLAGRIALVLLILALMNLTICAAPAQTVAKQKVIVHLTHYTDNLHAVSMAVHLAQMMQTTGADVTLLLDLDGVRLASTKETQNLVWGKGEPISKEYDAFVKAGGRVLLCPHCSENAGITERDLRPGARIGKHGELPKTILAANKVLDY
jgi:predicted peroxiredoxin